MNNTKKLWCPRCTQAYLNRNSINYCPQCGTPLAPKNEIVHEEKNLRKKEAKELAHHMRWLILRGYVK